MRSALRHPFGPALLIISILVAMLVLLLPALEHWSAQAPLILFVGVLTYVASFAVVRRWPSTASALGPAPEVKPEKSALNPAEPEESVADGPSDKAPQVAPPDFYSMVENALKRINDPAALSQCELIIFLPETILYIGSNSPSLLTSDDPAPLEQARILRYVLVEAINQFKPSDDSVRTSSPQSIQHQILCGAFLEGRPPAYFVTRFNFSEPSYYRNRRYAIGAMARHLRIQEDLISSQ